MNCRSSVASAKASIRAWSTVSQDETPTSCPMRSRIWSRLANGMTLICKRVNRAQSERRERRGNVGRAKQHDLVATHSLDDREQDRRAVLSGPIVVQRLVVIDEFEGDRAGP